MLLVSEESNLRSKFSRMGRKMTAGSSNQLTRTILIVILVVNPRSWLNVKGFQSFSQIRYDSIFYQVPNPNPINTYLNIDLAPQYTWSHDNCLIASLKRNNFLPTCLNKYKQLLTLVQLSR